MATRKSGSAGARRPAGSASKSGSAARGRSGPTAAQKRLSSERAAAARARIAQAQRRRRLFAVGGSVLGVIVIVAALIIVKVATGSGPESGKKATAATSTVLKRVGSVPASTLNAVAVGDAAKFPTAITAPDLTKSGKPEVLYVGAEYCPYCAAERWAVAVALSRFGTLHGVGQTTSSPSDVYPSTSTLSFHGATYTSSLLSLTAKELQSNQVVDGHYATLDTLTAAQRATVSKYNAAPYVKTGGGSIPFLDIGGKYIISGASYDPQVLQGKSHAQIAAALSDPSSKIARAVDGTANAVTAAICASTSQQPSAVCSSIGVKAAAAKLASSG